MTHHVVATTDFFSVGIGRRTFPFTTCEEVSAAYRDTIERLDLGASRTPQCSIFDASGNQVGYVSYNGRVWAGTQREWQPHGTPLFDPPPRGTKATSARREG